jgi:subtilase family serine protease
MLKSKRSRVVFGIGSLVAAVLAVAGTLLYVHTAQAATPTYHTHQIQANPHRVPAGTPKSATFTCQTDRGPTAIVCYSPQQLYQAYNINPLLQHGITGKGHTIVIVDAFQNPGMLDDIAAFDDVFGLPAPDFTQVAPDGLTPFDPNDGNMVGWAGEIALDVQWAHAMAPAAKIVLVLAKSNDDLDILHATEYAIDHNLGDVISQSFGENESCVDTQLLKRQHAAFTKATRKHITLLASSGDQGAAQPTCDGLSWTQAASSPASDPLVTAVGGTELHAAFDVAPPGTANPPAGTYHDEVALNQTNTPVNLGLDGNFSTGGGFSVIYHRPDFQNGVAHIQDHQRGVPDISYTAGINYGVIASFSIAGGFFIFGGTSVGSPCWAGLVALGDQLAGHRLGFINSSLYRIGKLAPLAHAAYHDVTVGNNTVTELDADGNPVNVAGFNALTGWDATTGLGTPKVSTLLPLLVAQNFLNDGDDAIKHNK